MMKVLVLHGLGSNLSKARKTSADHITCFQKYAPENDYFLHDINQPITKDIKEFSYDLILIDGTFLCYRWAKPSELFQRIKENYIWIANHRAKKIAFPQDDYDHSALLDEWLNELEVNLIYSICTDRHNVLYPICHKKIEILTALTGYVDDELVKQTELSGVPPLNKRNIDIGYRARELPLYFGSYGRMKYDLGLTFKQASAKHNLTIDISMDEKDTIYGKEWYKFMNKCKFMPGCMSGSSIIDKKGEVRKILEIYNKIFPNDNVEKIIKRILWNKDSINPFSMLSPRIFEASIFKVCQILVEGNYLPELIPGKHYLELKKDFSNIDEIFENIKDLDGAKEMADRNYHEIVNNKKYRYSQRVASVMNKVSTKNIVINLQNKQKNKKKISNKKMKSLKNNFYRISNKISVSKENFFYKIKIYYLIFLSFFMKSSRYIKK